MSNTNGPKKQPVDPGQESYNIEPGVEQICSYLDEIVELQKRSLEIMDRVLIRGEKLFSPEVFPKANKILTIENSFLANCMGLTACSQYLRNQALLSKIQLRNLIHLAEQPSCLKQNLFVIDNN